MGDDGGVVNRYQPGFTLSAYSNICNPTTKNEYLHSVVKLYVES